jgi:hypothetical protein
MDLKGRIFLFSCTNPKGLLQSCSFITAGLWKKEVAMTLQQRDEKILVGLFLNTSPKVTQQSNQFSVGHGSQVT